ncbi:hypothetical protein [Salinimicrobium sp. TH3]|uniref:hypothetical protein n=1 Tax=Salinimicrobium sp. TH3 TaxID=2997342 RepID=UPI002275FD74|nr:hypothetical protein [Salinimicrobium sp. TH3]MCY2685927.1 hypothetical protein [Salinimicrobium sp. TH3]
MITFSVIFLFLLYLVGTLLKKKFIAESIRCEKFVENHPEIWEADSKVQAIIQKIERNLSACPICQGVHYQLWNDNEHKIEYRCTGCKEIYNLNTTEAKIYINELKVQLITLDLLLAKVAEHRHQKGWEALKHSIKNSYDTSKNIPWIRTISLKGRGSLTLQKIP